MEFLQYPLLEGPLTSGGPVMRFLVDLTPLAVPVAALQTVRDCGVPVLISVPGALIVALALGTRWMVGVRQARRVENRDDRPPTGSPARALYLLPRRGHPKDDRRATRGGAPQ